jgi:hypothetical protein
MILGNFIFKWRMKRQEKQLERSAIDYANGMVIGHALGRTGQDLNPFIVRQAEVMYAKAANRIIFEAQQLQELCKLLPYPPSNIQEDGKATCDRIEEFLRWRGKYLRGEDGART